MKEVRGKRFGDESLAGLLRSQKKLTQLALYNTAVTDAGFRLIEQAHDLTELDVTSDVLGNVVLEVASRLPKLRSLQLGGMSRIDDNGLEHLRGLSDLTELYLNGTSITDRGLMCLAEMKNLWSLDLSGTTITDGGLGIIAALPALKLLTIESTPINGVGLACLKNAERLDVYASRAQLTDDGLSRSLMSLEKLYRLDISKTPISDTGLITVTACRNLEDLRISDTRVTDAILDVLADLPCLESLYVEGTRVTPTALTKLLSRKPGLTVYS